MPKLSDLTLEIVYWFLVNNLFNVWINNKILLLLLLLKEIFVFLFRFWFKFCNYYDEYFGWCRRCRQNDKKCYYRFVSNWSLWLISLYYSLLLLFYFYVGLLYCEIMLNILAYNSIIISLFLLLLRLLLQQLLFP